MLFYKIPTVKVLKGLLTITLSLILFAHLPSLPLENMLYEGLNGDLPYPYFSKPPTSSTAQRSTHV